MDSLGAVIGPLLVLLAGRAQPAGDQALGPPLNPLEMANPDAACVVYHLSQSQYRSLFEQVWGAQSFAINWPSGADSWSVEIPGMFIPSKLSSCVGFAPRI